MRVIERLKSYRYIKAEIVALQLDIEELEYEEIGPAAVSWEEKSGPTNKFSSSTENQVLSHMPKLYELQEQKRTKEREILRIDNALSVLDEKERMILESIYIKDFKWDSVTYRLDKSYSYCKKIAGEALKKLERFL